MRTNEQKQFPLVRWLVELSADAVNRHRRRRSSSRELDSLAPAEISAIARDLGVTQAELRSFAAAEPGSPRQLKLMLQALKIDRQSVEPLLMRDMQSLCSVCEATRRCNRELSAGRAKANFREFCPNAGSLQILVNDREATPLALNAA